MTDRSREEIQGYATVPNWVAQDLEISGHAKLVYLALSSRTSRHGQSWPSHALIAKEARIAVSSVKLALNELKSLGLVTWEKQVKDDGSLTSNRYTLYTAAPPSRTAATP